MAADATHSSERQAWETPPHIFDAINARFGPFNLDAAASPTNAKCPRYLTADDDATAAPWHAARAWCNPPYGPHTLQTAFVRKAIEELDAGHCELAVFLIPVRSDTRDRWHSHVFPRAAEIWFVKGRLSFIDEETGEPGTQGTVPSAVVVFRANHTGPVTFGTVDFDTDEWDVIS